MALVQNASVGLCPRQTDRKGYSKKAFVAVLMGSIYSGTACVCVFWIARNDGVGLQSDAQSTKDAQN